MKQQYHLTIPAGTKVLVRASGHVGLVREADDDYLVRFADGGEGRFAREELTIFKHEDAATLEPPAAAELERFVIYRCVVGSVAFGLDDENSDVDRRGIYLPPADLQWGLAGVPEQLEPDAEQCYWEIEKFIRLALKANPNVLECLYSPLVEECSPLAMDLLRMRSKFLSRHIYRTYNSYVLSQFKKLEQDLRNDGAPRWKHLMHLLRLLLAGIDVLRTGQLTVRVEEHRDRLLAVKRGERAWDEVEGWRLELHRRMDEAMEWTALPPHPDYEWANEYLLRARRVAAAASFGR
jgi:uncharacterized protein